MMQSFGSFPLALPAQPIAGFVGILGLSECAAVDGEGFVSCYFSPTHSPNPSLAPPGERGGLHLAASVKVGTLVHHGALASKWPQSIDGLCKSISTPRQRALKCLQQIEKPLNQFDGSAPMRTFFPPLKTRPNVAVSSLSAPAGVERVGVRGGIQRIRNKNAADNQFGNSNDDHCVQKILQKQEHPRHIARGLAVKKTQIISRYPQTVIKELTV
ncbi:hypothetical protein [Rhodoferax ferrireducens]|uniref:hypothetical protein n=1 Tax=Rhodoferax ferrireducens TaxID=192843 RepID=UPI003BB65628